MSTKEQVRATLNGFATGVTTMTIAVTLLTIPIKVVYLWGKFLWNLF